MNEKEIAEIRRRFRHDKSNISSVRGCYVNTDGEIISQFSQSLAITPQEESEKILAVLKRTLSGTLEKNLIDIVFTTEQVVDSEEHRLLMALRSSGLKDEEAIQLFYQHVIASLDLDENYMILLAHDTYDVPFRSKDGERQDDASTEVFSYILCSICPVKMTQPALSYFAKDNMLHNRPVDWIIAPPVLGFLFPAFDDRSANIYNALYYTKNSMTHHTDFIDHIFHCELPMPAAEQKETFQSILEETLAEECSLEVVQTVQEQLQEMIEEHKTRQEEPLTFTKDTIKTVLSSCDVSDSRLAAFERKFETEFGADAGLSPRNFVDSKLEVNTPDVTIKVNPERSDLVETRIIDGTKYIVIRVDDRVEVNGVAIRITEE